MRSQTVKAATGTEMYFGHAEHLHARRDARKFRERGRDVADEQREHGERGKPDAEALANERGEPLCP